MRSIHLLALSLLTLSQLAVADDAQRPFMLWNAAEAATVRRLVQTEDWAKAAAAEAPNLVKYGILGDRAAGEAEKKLLLADLAASDAATQPPLKIDTISNAYRYDVLYDLLAPAERQQIREHFTRAVESRMAALAPRKYTRSNWLPNLDYVSYMRFCVLAAAIGDREYIRKVFTAPVGLKWYLDEYLSDSGFYNEEFGKSMWMYEPMAQWCHAMDRLGLAEIGWDYRGRQGATFRGSIDSLIHITYPRVDLDRPYYHFARFSMGDARGGGSGLSGGPVAIFQHRLVGGDIPLEQRNQKGLSGYNNYANALEHLHARWPDAGYAYFLFQHQGDGKPYRMPLHFGMKPIDPAAAKPPPARSGLYEGRGIAMLRAEEGVGYWESPAPAVGLRLATAYAHHVPDSLAIAGFYAFNRPIYVNRSHATGYTGTDPGYSNSIRSHSAVMIDNREPAFLNRPLATRHDFGPLVKFIAARGKGMYPGVDQTRALMLTGEYMLDASHLVSQTPRDYLWQVHTFGQACPDSPADWAASTDLMASLPDLGNERSTSPAGDWSVSAVQTSGAQNPRFSTHGPRWFTDRIGARITMLGEEGTRAYHAWSPLVQSRPGDWSGRNRFAYGEDEPAGVAVVATRRAAATTFVAIHEPFKGTHRIRAVRRIAQNRDAVVVCVQADTFTDYLMLRFGDDAAKTDTMGGGTETFTFSDWGYVRVTARGMETAGRVSLKDRALLMRPADAPPGPIAARFSQPSALCLPTGGKGTRTLKLRNCGLSAITADVPVTASKGLTVSPASIALKGFAPGAERDVTIAIDAVSAKANAMHEVRVGGRLSSSLQVQYAALPVANGVATDGRVQVGAEFRQTIYSPHYIATYWFMESGGATELLDPAGFRRHDAAGHSYPSSAREIAGASGRGRFELTKVGKFPYFIPILVSGGEGQPRQFYDHGKHVHGFSGGLGHWFTEDWIIVRDRKSKPGEWTVIEFFPRGGYRSGLAESIPGRDGKLMAERLPGVAFAVDEQGKKLDLRAGKQQPARNGGVVAMYVRPDGYEHGSAAFYPPGSKWVDGRIASLAEQVVAFTFCTDAEFPALLKKWQESPPPNEAAPADISRSMGAFGPTTVDPE